MLISYNWLKELVPALKDYAPAKVAELLTTHSFETVIAKEFSLDEKITVVRIEKVEPHPNADRLRLATVTDGVETVRVVCGAPNIAVGQLVPLSPPGTKVLDKDGQLFELTIAKIRGVESPGMLNSRRELGLGTDHDGIFVLPEGTPLGSKLADHIPNDTVLEADITPNRAHDCLSHVGVAREIAAILDTKVSKPKTSKLPASKKEVNGYSLHVSDSQVVPRYLGLIVKNITNGISPLWMQARLMMLDKKPISALVDITNYVMWEQGNPSHAFDADQLPGKTIGTRFANQGEELHVLDGSKQNPDEQALLITADDVPVALAGIMGGLSTQVTNQTSTAVLEVANFQAYTIQKTALALNLRTDAAARFLKGIDSNLVHTVAERLSHLIKEITGATVAGVLDCYPHPFEPKQITLRPARVSKIAGTEILAEVSRQALERLRCTVAEGGDSLLVTPPSDRLDITGEHDLIEEIIFQVGLHTIPPKVDVSANAKPLAHNVFVKEKLRAKLSELGLTETYNYSFEPEKEARMLGISTDAHVELSNPVAPELFQLRASLLPGLLHNAIKNSLAFQRQNTTAERALFEIGHVYQAGTGGKVAGVIEAENVAGMGVVSFTAVMSELLEYLNVPEVSYQKIEGGELWQNDSQEIFIGETSVGIVGQLNARVASQAKYRLPLYAFEINLNEWITQTPASSDAVVTLADIAENSTPPVQYEALNRYPSVYRDVSLLVDVSLSVEQVKEVIERVGGELVADTDLFDEYEPDDEGAGREGQKKSLSFHIEYQAKDKTLTDEEVRELQTKIEAALKAELLAEVR